MNLTSALSHIQPLVLQTHVCMTHTHICSCRYGPPCTSDIFPGGVMDGWHLGEKQWPLGDIESKSRSSSNFDITCLTPIILLLSVTWRVRSISCPVLMNLCITGARMRGCYIVISWEIFSCKTNIQNHRQGLEYCHTIVRINYFSSWQRGGVRRCDTL